MQQLLVKIKQQRKPLLAVVFLLLFFIVLIVLVHMDKGGETDYCGTYLYVDGESGESGNIDEGSMSLQEDGTGNSKMFVLTVEALPDDDGYRLQLKNITEQNAYRYEFHEAEVPKNEIQDCTVQITDELYYYFNFIPEGVLVTSVYKMPSGLNDLDESEADGVISDLDIILGTGWKYFLKKTTQNIPVMKLYVIPALFGIGLLGLILVTVWIFRKQKAAVCFIVAACMIGIYTGVLYDGDQDASGVYYTSSIILAEESETDEIVSEKSIEEQERVEVFLELYLSLREENEYFLVLQTTRREYYLPYTWYTSGTESSSESELLFDDSTETTSLSGKFLSDGTIDLTESLRYELDLLGWYWYKNISIVREAGKVGIRFSGWEKADANNTTRTVWLTDRDMTGTVYRGLVIAAAVSLIPLLVFGGISLAGEQKKKKMLPLWLAGNYKASAVLYLNEKLAELRGYYEKSVSGVAVTFEEAHFCVGDQKQEERAVSYRHYPVGLLPKELTAAVKAQNAFEVYGQEDETTGYVLVFGKKKIALANLLQREILTGYELEGGV